jgi:hypothetical protein
VLRHLVGREELGTQRRFFGARYRSQRGVQRVVLIDQ